MLSIPNNNNMNTMKATQDVQYGNKTAKFQGTTDNVGTESSVQANCLYNNGERFLHWFLFCARPKALYRSANTPQLIAANKRTFEAIAVAAEEITLQRTRSPFLHTQNACHLATLVGIYCPKPTVLGVVPPPELGKPDPYLEKQMWNAVGTQECTSSQTNTRPDSSCAPSSWRQSPQLSAEHTSSM